MSALAIRSVPNFRLGNGVRLRGPRVVTIHTRAERVPNFEPVARNNNCQSLNGENRMIDQARIRVLSVDNHPLLREGIAAIINDQPDMLVVAQAAARPSNSFARIGRTLRSWILNFAISVALTR